jgi:hypothetical protein
VDFGAGVVSLPARLRVLDLRPGKHCPLPADGPVRWAALDALPQLLTVEWSGPARGIVEAVSAHPGIKFLYWFDAEGDVDLTRTRLDTVRIDGLGLRSVRLPASVRTLYLGRAPAHFDSTPPRTTTTATLQVDVPDAGHGLDLRLFHYGPDVVIPAGLRRSSQLWLWVGGEVSATVLATLTELETLRLTFERPPGAISDLPDLARHSRLHTLQFDSAYALAVDGLPDLPALRELELHGTRRATARAARARYQGSSVTVCTTGAKTDTWLELHVDNPFCNWVDDSRTFGRAACQAYNRWQQAARAVAADDPDRLTAAEQVLRGIVADLNTIDAEHHLIDTLRRDQAWDAYSDLAGQLGVPRAQAEAWFDDGRRF